MRGVMINPYEWAQLKGTVALLGMVHAVAYVVANDAPYFAKLPFLLLAGVLANITYKGFEKAIILRISERNEQKVGK
jgi:hypothetical protein